MPVKIAGETLHACSGCEISILDMGDRFIELLEFATLVHLPLLMDSKYEEKDSTLLLPKADVGMISGSIKTKEHLKVAKAMRDSCSIIIALGTCATHGGIPALANSYEKDDFLKCCYGTEHQDNLDSVPEMMNACQALDEHIHVDLFLPGCPPHPDQIFKALQSLEKKESFSLPEKSVCDNCPASRQGKGRVKNLKRALDLPQWESNDNKDFRCFLEQGFLCFGPVTRNGCGGDKDSALCIMARVPCRGCYGPVEKHGNQKLAMLNALVSNGVDISSMPETSSLLRFSGAHGRLRPTFGIRKK